MNEEENDENIENKKGLLNDENLPQNFRKLSNYIPSVGNNDNRTDVLCSNNNSNKINNRDNNKNSNISCYNDTYNVTDNEDNQSTSFNKYINSVNKIKENNDNINNYNNNKVIPRKSFKFKFIFSDNSFLLISSDTLINLSHSFFEKTINEGNIERNGNNSNNTFIVKMPQEINKEDMNVFLNIFNKGVTFESRCYIREEKRRLISLLRLMDLFSNSHLNVIISRNLLLTEPNKNSSSLPELLLFALGNLRKHSASDGADQSFFDLFYNCLEGLSKEPEKFFENLEKLKGIEKKILEELVSGSLKNVAKEGYIIKEKEVEQKFQNKFIKKESNKEKVNDEKHDNNNNNNPSKYEYFNTENNKKILSNKSKCEQIEKTVNLSSSKPSPQPSLPLSSFSRLISLLLNTNKARSPFDLLTLEYMSLMSSESLAELVNLPNPTFQVKIPTSEIWSYYEEFKVGKCGKFFLGIAVFYKRTDRSVNVCLKLHEEQKNQNQSDNENDIESPKKYNDFFDYDRLFFQIFTVLSMVKITKGMKKIDISDQISLISLTNDKSSQFIMKIADFDKAIKSIVNGKSNNIKDDFFSIIISLKICYTHSAILSYLLRSFNLYYNDKSIKKLPKNILLLLLIHKNLVINSENEKVISILNWLDDEVNIKEDITTLLINGITWSKVDNSLIIQLIIKYGNFIVGNEEIEKIIFDTFYEKCSCKSKENGNGGMEIYKEVVNKFLIELLNASKSLNYSKIFVDQMNHVKYMQFKADKDKNDVIISKYSQNHTQNCTDLGSNHSDDNNSLGTENLNNNAIRKNIENMNLFNKEKENEKSHIKKETNENIKEASIKNNKRINNSKYRGISKPNNIKLSRNDKGDLSKLQKTSKTKFHSHGIKSSMKTDTSNNARNKGNRLNISTYKNYNKKTTESNKNNIYIKSGNLLQNVKRLKIANYNTKRFNINVSNYNNTKKIYLSNKSPSMNSNKAYFSFINYSQEIKRRCNFLKSNLINHKFFTKNSSLEQSFLFKQKDTPIKYNSRNAKNNNKIFNKTNKTYNGITTSINK